MGSANMNSLKKCLRCYPKWLWSQRSQAADVLKCFSLELYVEQTIFFNFKIIYQFKNLVFYNNKKM